MYNHIIKCISIIIIISICQVLDAQVGVDTFKSEIDLDQVIVSANKTREAIANIAQEVKVIGLAQMKMLQSQNTADLLQSTGLAYIQKSQQGGGSVTLRGFEASRVLLMVDGVRMNNAIYRTGHLQNILTVDHNALSSIEILSGPSSIIYGSDALGGVVHMYTKKPQFKEADSPTGTFGNIFFRHSTVNNENSAHVDINLGKKNFASRTSITASSFGDLEMGKKINPSYGKPFGERISYVKSIGGKDSMVLNPNKYMQTPTAYKQIDLMQRFLYKSKRENVHGLNFQFSSSTDIPRYDRLTDNDGTQLSQAEWYYGPQKRLLAAYDFDKNLRHRMFDHFHLGINYQNIEESRSTRGFDKSNLTTRIEKLKVIGIGFDFEKKIANNQFRFGVDAQYNDLKSTALSRNINSNETMNTSTRYPDGKNKFIMSGIYFSHAKPIGSNITLNDGLRIGIAHLSSSFVNKTFFPFPYDKAVQNNFVYSVSAGLIYKIGISSKLSFTTSTGFRVPNIDDLTKIFDSTPGSIIVPNPELKPEKTINFEMNSIIAITKNLKFQNLVFYTILSDAIVTDRFQFNGKDSIAYDGVLSKVFANQNKREGFILGYSTYIDYNLCSSIRINGSLTYTYGRINEEVGTIPLDHIPPLFMRLGITYDTQNFDGVLYMSHNGWKRIKDYLLNGEDNERYASTEGMPSWTTLNVKLKYLFKKLNFALGIENLFDLQYRTFGSGINAGGRNFIFSTGYHF